LAALGTNADANFNRKQWYQEKLWGIFTEAMNLAGSKKVA